MVKETLAIAPGEDSNSLITLKSSVWNWTKRDIFNVGNSQPAFPESAWLKKKILILDFLYEDSWGIGEV